jgi:hypothetical protein
VNTALSLKMLNVPPLVLLSMLTVNTGVFADILVRTPIAMDAAEISPLIEALKQTAHTSVTVVSSQPHRLAEKLPPPDVAERLQSAEAAYRNLELDAAIESLKGVNEECVLSASYDGCRDFLYEAALLRGMSYLALKRTEEAEFEFRSAHIASPSSVLNPKKYSPSILRAFASACQEFETASGTLVHLRPSPDNAAVFADGNPVKSDAVRLSSGRHIIEVRLPGFDTKRLFVEVDAKGGGAPEVIAPVLPPSDDVTAWSALVAAVSEDNWTPAEPGMTSLLARFRIDAVLMLRSNDNLGEKGGESAVRLGQAGKMDILELPPVRLSAPISAQLQEALTAAFRGPSASKPVPSEGPAPPSAEEAASEDEEDDSLLDEEDEDPALQFDGSEEPLKPASQKKNIFKSPWLWISVGVVVAIVSGVVIAVKVQD